MPRRHSAPPAARGRTLRTVVRPQPPEEVEEVVVKVVAPGPEPVVEPEPQPEWPFYDRKDTKTRLLEIADLMSVEGLSMADTKKTILRALDKARNG